VRNSRKHIVIALVVLGAAAGGSRIRRWEARVQETPAAAIVIKTSEDGEARASRDAQNSQPTTPGEMASGNNRRNNVVLTGEVPAALTRSHRLNREGKSNEPITLTVVLKRTDQRGFEKFLEGVQDPRSQTYRQYLSPLEQADRFGPTSQTYQEISEWLDKEGFMLTDGSSNRLTITVRGTRAQAEKSFDVSLNDYRLDRRIFYANDRDPSVPADIAPNIQAVIGLTNIAAPLHARPTDVVLPPQYDPKGNLAFSCWYASQLLLTAKPRPFVIGGLTGYFCMAQQLGMLNLLASGAPPQVPAVNADLPGVEPAASGAGQKIGLLEFDNFQPSDVKDFLNLIGRSSQFGQLSQMHVAGGAGAPGAQESEVLLDIDAVMSLAPGAQVIVYDGPFNGRGSFQTMFNAMINDGVNVISNSWAYCEDQTTLADVQSIDSILASAGAAGITVLTGSGDNGSTCLNGSTNTCHVPATSPNITAVGGTTPTRSVGGNYGSESWWNSPLGGQGGFGISRFFGRPSYQNGLNSVNRRSIPDVTAPADPLTGYFICQASNGGCPTNLLYGGTSVAAPVWAAFVAVLNQQENRALGFLNPKLYPLANTNAFHSATQLGTDFQHVGLGSPNVNLLHLALTGATAGPFAVDKSTVSAFPASVVADGQTQAGVVVALLDANGNSVSGQPVVLTMNSGSHAVITTINATTNVSNGAALFTVTDTFLETVTFTATVNGTPLSQHPTVQFVSRPATAASIAASPTTVTANGTDTTTITVTLQDANGNPSPNKSVNLSQGNGASVITATTATTDATGKIQFKAVSNKAEAVTYTAVDVTDGNLPVPGNAVVNFVNASGFCGNTAVGTAAPGFAVTTFASNFPLDCFSPKAPIGLDFNANGTLFVGDVNDGSIYAFGPQGGTAGPATLIGRIPSSFGAALAGLTFTKDGRLYVGMNNGAKILEVNPATGAVIRVVANTPGDPLDMHVDPLSGDIFFSTFDGIYRLTNFANGPGTVTLFSQGGFTDGFIFAPDGTIYEKAGTDGIFRVTGTNTPNPGTATQIAFVVGGADGIALEQNPAAASKPFLYVNRNDGIITRIDLSAAPPSVFNCNDPGAPCTNIFTGGSRGDFATVSPQGCLYATQSDRVIKITKADGTCSLLPSNPAPQIVLTPENVQPSPAQGTTVTFTATLRNVASSANIPISLFISGANPSMHLVNTDSAGKAVFTYTGVATGTDRVFASADLGNSVISSNEAVVGWTAGRHSTFLNLNQSPTSGVPNQPLMLTASLVDISVLPPAPVGGASVTLMLASQTCTATTNSAGLASCSVTPAAAPGSYPLNATFTATSTLLASSARKTLSLISPVNQSTVQFSTANYTVQEDCTALTITVNRVGDASAAASVDYFTTDGTATERRDYITALGKLQFAAGETTKSFAVLINEDSYVEGTENFSITLTNQSGVGIAFPAIATVTITDDASEPASNPIDDPRNYVCQNYHDFLNRQPDTSGWDFWTNEITSCGNNASCIEAKRINVSGAFFLSIEFQQTGYLVERMYKVAYGDASNSSAIGGTHSVLVPVVRFTEFLQDTQRIGRGVVVLAPGWEQALENNKQAYASEFVASSRFIAAFPTTLTPAQFVDKLNQNAGNVLSASERIAAINLFSGAADSSNTTARAQALRQVAEDQDLFKAESNRAFVLMQYLGYLRRNPNDPQDTDYSGFDFWLQKLNQFNGDYVQAEMVKAFISSGEYRQRFGP
jgi:hypothetical protein